MTDNLELIREERAPSLSTLQVCDQAEAATTVVDFDEEIGGKGCSPFTQWSMMRVNEFRLAAPSVKISKVN